MEKIIKEMVYAKIQNEGEAYYEASEGETIFLYADGSWETAIKHRWDKSSRNRGFLGAAARHLRGRTRSWAKDYLQKRYELGKLNGEIVL